VRDHPLLWIASPSLGVDVEIWNNESMVGWNVCPKQLVAQLFLNDKCFILSMFKLCV
jgi:hypothetical protein